MVKTEVCVQYSKVMWASHIGTCCKGLQMVFFSFKTYFYCVFQVHEALESIKMCRRFLRDGQLEAAFLESKKAIISSGRNIFLVQSVW